jgi:hypothetical protein
MLYQIVSPIVTDINGDSFKEALKNYLKINHNISITNLIIKDRERYYEAKLRYYKQNQKNKVGIDVYPYPTLELPNKQIVPLVNPYNPVVNRVSPINPFVPVINPIVPVINPIVPVMRPSPMISPFVSPYARPPPVIPVIGPAVINNKPIYTEKGSSVIATDSHVFIKRPAFY